MGVRRLLRFRRIGRFIKTFFIDFVECLSLYKAAFRERNIPGNTTKFCEKSIALVTLVTWSL